MGTNVLQTRRSRLKRVPSLLLMMLVAWQFASHANASLTLIGVLDPDPDNSSPAKELLAIQGQFPGNEDLLYFQRWNTNDNLPAGGSYDQNPGIGTYTFNPPGNVGSMDITWDFTSVDFELAYVLVKGANIWNLYGVTIDQVKNSLGPQEIFVQESGTPGISHVSFFGFASDSPVVPEPATMIVWGGLAGCACVVASKRVSRASKR